MAATSHPLATMTAIDVLRDGGNAVDAAIAAAAVLCLAEPHMTGIGGDCFVLYSPKGGLPIALNGSGRAPAAASLDWYLGHGFDEIPERSAHAVTVPGAVDAWFRLLADHGTREMAALLQPAIRLAEEGCPVAPRVAYDFTKSCVQIADDPVAAEIFWRGGAALDLGDQMRQPLLAATLRHIAKEGRRGFYEGPVADDMVLRLRALGGLHTLEDFSDQHAVYETPICSSYAGHEVYECPPNGQGIVALMMLNTLAGFDLFDKGRNEAERIHLLAEATKAAYKARDAYFCDPVANPFDVDRYLSDEYADQIRAGMNPRRASDALLMDEVEHKDTIYLAVVDRDGNAISFINSLFAEFGCGIMAPKSGVLFHSRGSIFRVVAGSSKRHRSPQAAAPHHYSRHAGEERTGGDAIRGHGRPLSGDRSRPFSRPPADGRVRPAGRRRSAAELRLWWKFAARTDDQFQYRRRTRANGPHGRLDDETAWWFSGNPDRCRTRHSDRRVGSA